MDQFYVTVTAPSILLVEQATATVAGQWQTEASQLGRVRVRQTRSYFSVASAAAKKAASKKGLHTKIPAPAKKVLKKPKVMIENLEKNYTRSSKGFELIRQRMTALHDLDRAVHPGKPAFAADSGLCRLQPHGFDWMSNFR